MVLFDDVTVGCSSGSVRLEGLSLAAGASGASSKATSPTVSSPPRRPEVGAKFTTPFALRDPVLIRFASGRLSVTRTNVDRTELASCALASVAKIVRTVTGVTVVAEGAFTAELSIHEDAKADALVKLLHAKTRGAPPPKETRPVTRPLRTKSRVCGASVPSSRSSSMEPQSARKSARESLSSARDRSASRNGDGLQRYSLTGSAGEQAEADRDRRRQELYRQLTQLKKSGGGRR